MNKAHLEVIALVESSPVREKRPERDFDLLDIQTFLSSQGFSISERSLRRIISGMGLQKAAGGFYGKPEVALILAWEKRRDRYFSYQEFMRCEGQTLYQRAQVVFC